MSAVKASSHLDPIDYLDRCKRASALRGFRIERYGEVDFRLSAGSPPTPLSGPESPAAPVGAGAGSAKAPGSSARPPDPAVPPPAGGTAAALIALTRRTPGVRPRIYLSSGIHGDEPAAPEALLQLMEMGAFDDRATWFLAPLLNPEGFQLRTRENADVIDLNRDYLGPRTREVRAHVRWLEAQPPFDLGICLHEDWEATGFYLYELNPEERPSLAHVMLQAARVHMRIDPAAMIDGRPVDEPGILRPHHEPVLGDLWAEAIYLRAHHTRLVYTVETPSTAPLAQRIATLTAAVQAALAAFFDRPGARSFSPRSRP